MDWRHLPLAFWHFLSIFRRASPSFLLSMDWRRLPLAFWHFLSIFRRASPSFWPSMDWRHLSLGYLAVFNLFLSSQSIVLTIHGLVLTFYLACGEWGQSMLELSAEGGPNTRKEAGFLPYLDKTYLLTIFPATRPKVIISAMAFPPRRLEP